MVLWKHFSTSDLRFDYVIFSGHYVGSQPAENSSNRLELEYATLPRHQVSDHISDDLVHTIVQMARTET